MSNQLEITESLKIIVIFFIIYVIFLPEKSEIFTILMRYRNK